MFFRFHQKTLDLNLFGVIFFFLFILYSVLKFYIPMKVNVVPTQKTKKLWVVQIIKSFIHLPYCSTAINSNAYRPSWTGRCGKSPEIQIIIEITFPTMKKSKTSFTGGCRRFLWFKWDSWTTAEKLTKNPKPKMKIKQSTPRI